MPSLREQESFAESNMFKITALNLLTGLIYKDGNIELRNLIIEKCLNDSLDIKATLDCLCKILQKPDFLEWQTELDAIVHGSSSEQGHEAADCRARYAQLLSGGDYIQEQLQKGKEFERIIDLIEGRLSLDNFREFRLIEDADDSKSIIQYIKNRTSKEGLVHRDGWLAIVNFLGKKREGFKTLVAGSLQKELDEKNQKLINLCQKYEAVYDLFIKLNDYRLKAKGSK